MSPAGIDFARLSLRDALDIAILIEEEARDRYQELADQLLLHHTPKAAAWFEGMSRIEERHRQALASRRTQQFGDEPTGITRQLILEVEAPDYDEARAFMSVRQALQTALQAETRAFEFYRDATAVVTDRGVAALFAELRDEEVEHQAMVHAEIARLPPDTGNGDAYADEPQGL